MSATTTATATARLTGLTRLPRRLSAVALNGIAVACGIGCIQLVALALGGPLVAQLAAAGAVSASLADVPNTVARTAQRVSAAAVLAFLAALTVGVLAPHPRLLGCGVAVIAFVAMMTMAWGARAAAVSFAPVISLVFTMALPAGEVPLWQLAACNAAGGAAYLGWSLLAGRVLQPRYRALAMAEALRACAGLLRARAALMVKEAVKEAVEESAAEAVQGSVQEAARDSVQDAYGGDAGALMRAWVQGEALLAERLQSARDFTFAERDSRGARRDTAVLLRTIDLRDVLLASRLDLELLGRDNAGRRVMDEVAAALVCIADALESAADAMRDGRAPPPPPALDFDGRFAAAAAQVEGARARLLPALASRLRSLGTTTTRIHALLHGVQEPSPLTREELQRFVAPEGWPLRALKAQGSWSSPVLRHALRSALALSSAYFIALSLPWASHPHWLVLSVAVVLRGNLEQTLARRNARVLGTLLGCVVVVSLSGVHSAAWLSLVFLTAVGTAHASVTQRYWLAATAATVMALLQSHAVNPDAGFAVAERVADTILGASLAWGFSYVLPSWERRSLPAAVTRVLRELSDYAGHALRQETVEVLQQRLARRRAYDALSALAGALQRSAAEPASVRVPVPQVAALIDHGQRLMAHLSLVRMTLSRGGEALAAPAVAQALAEAQQRLAAILDPDAADPGPAAAARDAPREAPPEAPHEDEAALLPRESPAQDVLPWLLRRLRLLVHDAAMIRRAALALAPARPEAPAARVR